MEKLYLKGVNGQLTVDENFVIIERKGVMGFMTQGLSGEKRIPIANVKAVQLRDAGMMVNGFIQLSILGGLEKAGGILNAGQDENTVIFSRKFNDLAHEIRDYLEKVIIENQKPKNNVVNQLSSADEIMKYKKLMDDGIISEDEFIAKKRNLLGL